jgi:hypothetical protein
MRNADCGMWNAELRKNIYHGRTRNITEYIKDWILFYSFLDTDEHR